MFALFTLVATFFLVVADAGKNVTITSYGAQSGGLENTLANTKVFINPNFSRLLP